MTFKINNHQSTTLEQSRKSRMKNPNIEKKSLISNETTHIHDLKSRYSIKNHYLIFR
jgi:hypothetical protein